MNNFKEQFEYLYVCDSYSWLYNKMGEMHPDIIQETREIETLLINNIKQIKDILFTHLYRYNDFELNPTKNINNFRFHCNYNDGVWDFWKQFSNGNKKLISFYSLECCPIPRIRRDAVLAWSIRKDFYKYYIKLDLTNQETTLKEMKFLESILPLEENMFFIFEDGIYICNLISDENLNKLKERYDSISINDHELYFELDKNIYKPQTTLPIEGKIFSNFTYLFLYIDFQKYFKNFKSEGRNYNSILQVFKDKNFLQQFDKESLIEFSNIGLGVMNVMWNDIHYQKYIEKEWKRIPNWYKEFVTEEDINIKQQFEIYF